MTDDEWNTMYERGLEIAEEALKVGRARLAELTQGMDAEQIEAVRTGFYDHLSFSY